MTALAKNIGYSIDGVVGFKQDGEDFGKKQKEAWDTVKRSIDVGIPCFAWEMVIPEFYVVYGYDDDGYYFTGPGGVGVLVDQGYKPWRELGASEIGVVEIYNGTPGQAADDTLTVKEALAFALKHAQLSSRTGRLRSLDRDPGKRYGNRPWHGFQHGCLERVPLLCRSVSQKGQGAYQWEHCFSVLGGYRALPDSATEPAAGKRDVSLPMGGRDKRQGALPEGGGVP